ncbi:MAG: hypothetical protein RI947_1203 [Candidatus Parcubacteria bacterium]|jgi:hypothetical protein
MSKDGAMTPNPPPLKANVDQPITLSPYSSALVQSVKTIPDQPKPDENTKLTVSQTVSFMAIAYEKVRNAIEYREDHLIRRAAIERILRRRLAMNASGKGESENLLRELTWARYFPNGSLDEDDIDHVQNIIDKYLLLRKVVVTGRDNNIKKYLYDFFIDMLTCEIEETLSPSTTFRDASFNYFLYQTLRQKIHIEELTEEQKDAYFLVALEKAYRKSDSSYQRYHLFTTFYKPLSEYTPEELANFTSKLPQIFKRIDDMIKNPYVERLQKFAKKQLPPYLILFEIMKDKKGKVDDIFKSRALLWNEVDLTCREKYQQASSKLKTLAFKSLIYIFVTKMLFAIILEYPVSLWLYNEVHWSSIAINSLFPPILMMIIVLFFKLPGDDNTQRIYYRIIDIIDSNKEFETTKVMNLTSKSKIKKPVLVFGFTIFYTLTFFITLFLIHEILLLLSFNIISQLLFVFFVSVITFFSYRIKQVVNEYRLISKEQILTPLIDFFFMPILSLGKFFSTQLGRLNFFIVIFDFIIEAPFKLIIEVVEEWISFVKARKEEIA